MKKQMNLLKYQGAWADDPSRWKFGLMSRQVGKDFASGFEGIRDCLRHERQHDKTDWLIAAPSERQALESLQKWKNWTWTFKLSIHDYTEQRRNGPEGLLTAATLTFSHGSRVIALPGKPETVRGYSANVLLTEFAFFEQPDQTWRSLYASITNPLQGGLKKVRIITTPNGIGNMAHDIWAKNFSGSAVACRDVASERRPVPTAPSGVPPLVPSETSGGTPAVAIGTIALPDSPSPAPAGEGRGEGSPIWSCHFVDIYTAKNCGLPVNIEELKAGMDDPEGWAQEFECQFLDVQSTLLPYDLIASCESLEATAAVPPEFWPAAHPAPLIMGLDFGRKRDLTVAWTLQQLGDVLQTVEVLEMGQTPTPDQVEQLRPRLRQVRRVCLDCSSPGIGLADYLVKEFGEWNAAQHKFGKIELCNFSNPLKLEIFSKLRMAFETRGLRVPVSRVIREDLHSINRVTSASGQITYRAPYSADGHADRCTALALAVRAADAGGSPTRISSASVKVDRGIGDMGLGIFRAKDWPM